MVIAIIILSIIILVFSVGLILMRKGNHSELQEGFSSIRREMNENFSSSRLETAQNQQSQNGVIQNRFTEFMTFLQNFQKSISEHELKSTELMTENLQKYGDRTEMKFSALEKSVDARLKAIQEESTHKLEEMKHTVDEKLQASVEKHFNESFKLISERLEMVHKGLGEMQSLATGVGDLKKVLTNVKTRGNIGEIQLSSILSQYLSPEQFVANFSVSPERREVVEFAVKLPGNKNDEAVYLPVDSKFPVEDFNRLITFYGEYPQMSPEVKKMQESFARTVRSFANDISTKYIYPPTTTAFGLMFVPSEGIYAEILRIPGLFEQLQTQYHVVVVGPANLVAFLNSLQIGFKTLAIEKRSNEVWKILGSVKTEFAKFGEEMESTRKSLQAVVNHVEKIGTRSRALERQLKDVQEMPVLPQKTDEEQVS